MASKEVFTVRDVWHCGQIIIKREKLSRRGNHSERSLRWKWLFSRYTRLRRFYAVTLHGESEPAWLRRQGRIAVKICIYVDGQVVAASYTWNCCSRILNDFLRDDISVNRALPSVYTLTYNTRCVHACVSVDMHVCKFIVILYDERLYSRRLNQANCYDWLLFMVVDQFRGNIVVVYILTTIWVSYEQNEELLAVLAKKHSRTFGSSKYSSYNLEINLRETPLQG